MAQQSRRVVVKWLVTLVIGIITGLFAFLLALGIQWSLYGKMLVVYALIERCDGCLWQPYLVYLAITFACVGISATFVSFVEPAAGGSGIPEIKCYLNGIKVPHVVRLQTLFIKVSEERKKKGNRKKRKEKSRRGKTGIFSISQSGHWNDINRGRGRNGSR